jgi:TolB-like protein
MKSNKFLRFLFLAQFAGVLIFFGTDARAAESSPLHLAIVPFSAPPGNGDIQKIAASASDLLMAGLSQDDRFQLVEREKVNAIWSELNLAESGFVSTDTVEKFGRVLSCDWLVSGSIVQVETNTEVWVKVIDVQSSVVLDLQSFPYNAANFSATISAISDFVAKINPQAQPRQFIALGNFVCQNATPGHREWTQRLPALIEKHFLALGYGVVERSTVSPIFSEYQLETAGLTGDSTNRVRLKPAFWIVSGEYKYNVDATPERLDMILHMQKAGADEQFFFLNKPAGYEIEKALVDTIQSVLTKSNPMTLEQAQTGEANIRTAHIQELTKGRGERPIDPLYDTNTPSITITDAYGGTRRLKTDPAWQAVKENHKNDMINSLEQAILLNPKDMRSKFMLGMALFGVSDAVDSKHGQDLLEEVTKSGDPVYSIKAKNWLEDVRTGKISFQRDRFGKLNIVTHGQPASFSGSASPNIATQQAAPINAKATRFIETTNVAAKAENFIQIPSPPAIAYIDDSGITAFKIGRAFGKGPLLIACGTTLKSFDWTGSFGPGSGTEFEKVNLPLKIEHPITAIATDASDLWLGTEGGGLIRIPQSGEAPRIFNEKDGFPMSSIKSLRLEPGRLLIGFGYGSSGAFGYLDLASIKFTGMMSKVVEFKSWEERLQPPPSSSVLQIRTEDDTNIFWIASDLALYRLKLDSQQWSLSLPSHDIPNYRGSGGLWTLSVFGGFAVTIIPSGGVAFCKLSGDQWTHLNLSTNLNENYTTTLAQDSFEPNHLWIGSRGKITIIDMNTRKIIGECKMVRPGTIEFIVVYEGDVFFIGDDAYSGSYDLYHLAKPRF